MHVNISPYFLPFARLFGGFGNGFLPIFLGKFALLTDETSREANNVFVEGMDCLGCAVGPVIASFLSFRTYILGWTTDEEIHLEMLWQWPSFSVWLAFCFYPMIFGRTMLQVLTQSDDKKDKKENDDQKLHKRKAQEERKVRLMDLRISCLLFLTFLMWYLLKCLPSMSPCWEWIISI